MKCALNLLLGFTKSLCSIDLNVTDYFRDESFLPITLHTSFLLVILSVLGHCSS